MSLQRINTHGGVAQGTCDQPGSFLSVPYSADYRFVIVRKIRTIPVTIARAALAEKERALISQRTKAALKAVKLV